MAGVAGEGDAPLADAPPVADCAVAVGGRGGPGHGVVDMGGHHI